MMERISKNYTLLIGTVGIVLVMVFSPPMVFAQEFDEPNILPDSPFYAIKLAIETIRETFTFQDERRAELFLKHSEERDREAEALERQGKMIPIERLKEIQAQKLRDAEVIIMRLERAQNIQDQEQKAFDERRELARATNEQERIAIQMQQRTQALAEQSNLIETRPDMGLIEPNTARIADRPVTIIPVKDIEETDDERTILMKLRDRLENSFSSSEITEIRAKFAEVREEDNPERKELLAIQLDDQVNNPLVSITCFGRVNTLSLSIATDPVRELQKQCPILSTFDTELVRDVVNGGS